jgi:Zn-dependent protease
MLAADRWRSLRNVMNKPFVPPAPETLFTLAGTPIQADLGAPLHLGGVAGLCWSLVGQRYPEAVLLTRLRLTVLWTLLFEAAYLVHSTGHILSARAIGAPMDALVLTAVQQVNIYYNEGVPPDAHLGRAIGGPLASLIAVLLTRPVRRLLPRGPFARDLLDVFLTFNVLIGGVSLIPIPSLDGGSLIKWAVYNDTGDLQEAARTVREAGMNAAILSGAFSAAAFLLRRKFTGAALAAFGVAAVLDSLRRD